MSDPMLAIPVFICSLILPNAAAGDGGSSAAPKNPPAAVEGRVSENSLTTITLTSDAVRRLAIQTAPVTDGVVERRRLFAATVEIAPGRDVSFVAPIAGAVVRAQAAGTRVETGDVVLVVRLGVDADGRLLGAADRVAVLRSIADLDAARVEAESSLKIAEEKSKAAEIELARAEKLASDKAGSARAVDEARAVATMANAEREGAKIRATSLSVAIQALTDAKPFELELRAPFAGEIVESPAPTGSLVSAGTVLARLVGTDDLLIRVVVPNSIASGLDRDRAFLSRGSDRSAAWIESRSAPAPVASRGTGATVELVFAADPAAFEPRLGPGERIVAALARPGASSLSVPHAALLRDAAGGEWVYVEVREGVYTRKRVSVRDVIDGRAVLASGPEIGTKVVTDGAAELFGTEFGVGK